MEEPEVMGVDGNELVESVVGKGEVKECLAVLEVIAEGGTEHDVEEVPHIARAGGRDGQLFTDAAGMAICGDKPREDAGIAVCEGEFTAGGFEAKTSNFVIEMDFGEGFESEGIEQDALGFGLRAMLGASRGEVGAMGGEGDGAEDFAGKRAGPDSEGFVFEGESDGFEGWGYTDLAINFCGAAGDAHGAGVGG